ncbi:MAG TPA: pitrilysin family protein [Bryobacteraceae bacterium]|nr:pitrilysin family protein [Bryobacteraceae bacterium]
MKLRLIAVVLFALGRLAPAQGADLDIPYQKFVLKNGLTVIVHEDHKAPIVAVNVWYHVGSKNERIGKTGFAHLFEHLMFGGSEHYKRRYIEAMEPIGATDLNGTTNTDRTNYFEDVPTPALDYTLWLESDRMGHMLGAIDQKTLDLQRGVVQNEKRQGENRPYGMSWQLVTQNTYPAGHPYSWTVIGSMDDLNAASMQDVQEWFKTYYGPSNAVIAIAGDIDAKTAREKAEKYFGDIPAGPPIAAQRVWIAKMTGAHREVYQDRVPQARIYKVWNVPQWGSADADYLRLVSNVLSSGKTSRLYKRLVYDDQIATDVTAYIDERELGSQFGIQATARPGDDLTKVEKAMDEELARFLEAGPNAHEVERVKTEYLAHFIRGAERIGGFGGKSDLLATSEIYGHSPDAYKITLKRVQDATPQDLAGAARRWLSDGVFVLEIYPYPSYTTAATGVDRSKPPEPGTPPGLRLPKLEHASLANGLKVILAERHEIPVVNFWLALDAGYAADQFAAPGTAKAATALLTGGTKTRSALEISDEIEMLGAQLGAFSNLDMSIVHLSALKTKLDASLALYADVILNPSFPQADFERQKKLQLAAIKREKVTGIQMGLRVFPALLFGKGHAYGNPFTGSGTEASVTNLTREDLVKFHQTWFHPNGATLVIAGDTTLAEVTPKLEQLFAGWQRGEAPHKNVSRVPLPSKSTVYILDRPGAQQSDILAGEIAPPKNNPEEIAIETMNAILGGEFGARINMNLREDKHWSYGAQSILIGARGQQPYVVYAPVQTDKTKDSLVEINNELHGIAGQHPPTDEELKKAQDTMTLRLPGSRETIDEVGDSVLDLVQFGLPDEYYQTYAAKIRALHTADVTDAAKTVVHPDNVVWVVVGDRAKIEAPIRELGLGEVKFLDADGNPI